jgi:ketosteroid isomerase-like protein
MRTFLLPSLLALVLLVPAARAQEIDYQDAMAAMQALMETQQRRFEATVRSDVAALDSIFAPNMVYTHSSGQVDTKEVYLESLRSGALDYIAIEPSDLNVQVYSDVGVITGQADVKSAVNGEERAMTLRFIEVYVQWNKGDPWQLVAWQSTRLP